MSDELENAFSALRRDYAASLPAKLDELAAALDEAERSGAPAALAQATSLAHRLAGTAGSYGLAEVSASASVLEEKLGGKDFAAARAAFISLTAVRAFR